LKLRSLEDKKIEIRGEEEKRLKAKGERTKKKVKGKRLKDRK
jgi:hypothetical protein